MSISNVRFTGYEAVGPSAGKGKEINSTKPTFCGPQNTTDPNLKTDTTPQLQDSQKPQLGNKLNSMA